ncbi:hypothetical protein AQV86_00760 [Nanohaloarchaea archaeon SG9]|nr:hypothetical protein AQV86_00760 [Nanohaloarchaea archaeon SG9]
MTAEEQMYGPFRMEETYALVFSHNSDTEVYRDVEEVLDEVKEDIGRNTYEDLADIYGEEALDEIDHVSHLDDVQDGVGCTEIWEKMSERRAQD